MKAAVRAPLTQGRLRQNRLFCAEHAELQRIHLQCEGGGDRCIRHAFIRLPETRFAAHHADNLPVHACQMQRLPDGVAAVEQGVGGLFIDDQDAALLLHVARADVPPLLQRFAADLRIGRIHRVERHANFIPFAAEGEALPPCGNGDGFRKFSQFRSRLFSLGVGFRQVARRQHILAQISRLAEQNTTRQHHAQPDNEQENPEFLTHRASLPSRGQWSGPPYRLQAHCRRYH